MKGHWWLSMMLTAGLMTGCSADEPIAGGGVPIVHPDVTPTAVTEPEITFQVSDDWQNMADTRATIFPNTSEVPTALTSNTYGGGSFKAYAYSGSTTTPYFSGTTVNYNTDAWSFADGKHYWPATGDLSFFVHMPADLTNTYCTFDPSAYDSGTNVDGYAYNAPKIVCANLPVTSAGQAGVKELIFAYATGKNKTNSGESGVALNFRHPFAVVKFAINTHHTPIHRFNSITITHIYNNGTYTHGNTPQWSTSGELTDLVVSLNQEIAVNANFTADQLTAMGSPFIVIPQGSFDAGHKIVVNLKWNEGDANATTYTFDNPISEFECGKIYSYTLDLNNKFSVTIIPWVEDSRSLDFSDSGLE